MINAFLKTTIFLVIIIFSYILKRVGFIKDKDLEFVSKIVIYITMPAAIVSNFTTDSINKKFYLLFFLGAIVNLVLSMSGYILSGEDKDKRAFNIINYSGFNYGSFSLPYISTMLNSTAVTASCLFDAGNSIFCTGGSFELASLLTNKREKENLKKFIKGIFSSPAFLIYIMLIVLSIFSIKLPNYLIDLTKTIGGANGFLAMMMIGLSLNISKDILKKGNLKVIIKLFIVRFVIIGIVIYLITLLVIPNDIKAAIIMLLLSPICSLNLVYTKKMGLNYELSTQITSISILISALVLIVVSPILIR